MRVEFSVRNGAATCDVAVSAPAPVPLSAFAAELARTVGARPDGAIWSGEMPLAGTTALGAAGLRTGAVLNFGGPHRALVAPGVLSLHQVGGPDAGRVVPVGVGRIVIGRDPGCDLVLSDSDVSRRHAVLEVSAGAITVRDCASTNGTFVEGHPVGSGGARLRPGEVLRVGDSSLAVAGPSQTPAAVAPTPEGTLRVLRPPRQLSPVAVPDIDVPTRSSAARPRGVQWVTALLPAAAGGAIAWATDSAQFLLFALLSPLMMLSSSLGDRLHWRRSRRREAASYVRRRVAADAEIERALRHETYLRRLRYPDPAAVVRVVELPGSRLWERRRSDDDLLHVSVGTADIASAVRIRRDTTVEPAGTVHAVPFPVDLRCGPLGLTGPRERLAGTARWLVGQLAVLHSPADLEISALLAGAGAGPWDWLRWLPHVRGRVGCDEAEWNALVAELAAVVDQRHGRRRGGSGAWSGPWHVVLIDNAARVGGVIGLAGVLERGAEVGVTALCLDDDATALPAACATVVQVDGDSGSRARVRGCGAPAQPVGSQPPAVLVDAVSPRWADTLARRLAALVDGGDDAAGGVPDSCGLLDTLGRDPRDRPGTAPERIPLTETAVRARWSRAAGGAATALGLAADGPLVVDLVADGPHALIAGTTGSGKSELLQSLVAGLAANHSPADVNFLLIDYKGGAAFADCARLPHTSAMVTDLDAYLTERALRSLRSELRRREALFAAAGVADLAGYRRSGSARALARLIIVVDEFAALADELPDFVRGLVGVAQRGRSLGVHLVLATQRPGSAVSPEIRANTSLRIALRTTDPGESSDVVDSPDAATIERSRPGRAYLRAGAALTCFQTAYAASPVMSAADVVVEPLGAWRRPGAGPGTHGAAELSLLVAALRAAAAGSGCPPAERPWLPPLPDRLARSTLPAPADGAGIAVARIDLPDEQRQPSLELDLAAGPSLLVAGAPRSGRTSVLLSVLTGAAERFGPDRLAVYVVDAAGALGPLVADVPHCATVLGPDELGSATTLLHRLERACGATSPAPATAGGAPPLLNLLLVDGWDSLIAGRPDVEALECADSLATLLRLGPAAALTIAVTGDRGVLAPRLATGFTQKIVLNLADRNDYGLVNISPRGLPVQLPPGRALRGSDGAMLQVAHAGDSPDLTVAARALQALAPYPPGGGPVPRRDAVRLRPLPRHVPLSALPRSDARGRLALGLAGDRAEPVHIDLFTGAGRVLVAGPPRSGRSTVLRSLLTQAVAAGVHTVVAAGLRSPLHTLAGALAVPVVAPGGAGPGLGPVPRERTLLLVDDCEGFLDHPSGDALTEWVRDSAAPLAAIVAGRADDLATTYRGLGAQMRRAGCGLLLRPGPVDGEILGVHLPRHSAPGPPGRGVLVGDPAWGAVFADGDPLPVQVAQP